MDQVEEFYDQDAAVYDNKRFRGFSGKYEAQLHQKYLQKFSTYLPGESTLLEIGPGTGRFSKPILEQGYNLTAFDLSKNMLETVSQKLDQDDVNQNINLFQGDGRNLPFKEGSFDGCLMINVTSHLPDAKSVINEISSALTSGGHLLINFPNLSGIYYPVGKYVNFQGRSVQEDVFSRWYSYREMVKLLTENGFEIVEEFGNMITPRREFPFLNKSIVFVDILLENRLVKRKSGYVFFIAKKV